MLILTRRAFQKIIVNEDLIIEVVSIDIYRMQVKLGFEADRDKYLVDRYEIFERKVEERA